MKDVSEIAAPHGKKEGKGEGRGIVMGEGGGEAMVGHTLPNDLLRSRTAEKEW